jgi:hypothetical protein
LRRLFTAGLLSTCPGSDGVDREEPQKAAVPATPIGEPLAPLDRSPLRMFGLAVLPERLLGVPGAASSSRRSLFRGGFSLLV